MGYYDTRGRTWERQAYIKARPVAGDLSLGNEFLAALWPWVYRRYLSHADISGIKALKRRIEQQTLAGVGGGKGDRSNLCEAPGGRAPAEGWSRQIGPVPFPPSAT